MFFLLEMQKDMLIEERVIIYALLIQSVPFFSLFQRFCILADFVTVLMNNELDFIPPQAENDNDLFDTHTSGNQPAN